MPKTSTTKKKCCWTRNKKEPLRSRLGWRVHPNWGERRCNNQTQVDTKWAWCPEEQRRHERLIAHRIMGGKSHEFLQAMTRANIHGTSVPRTSTHAFNSPKKSRSKAKRNKAKRSKAKRSKAKSRRKAMRKSRRSSRKSRRKSPSRRLNAKKNSRKKTNGFSPKKNDQILKKVVKTLRDYKEEGCIKDNKKYKCLGWKRGYNCKYEKEFQKILDEMNKDKSKRSRKSRRKSRRRKSP